MENKLWDKCVEFHGHSCPGLAIGYKASEAAKSILKLSFSKDEEIVCVTENDACGVDAIQVLMGCSVGKGNLIFRIRGKQAFSFYNRKNNESIRLVFKGVPDDIIEKEEKQAYILSQSYENLFEVKDTNFVLPEAARIFKSERCEQCGENTAEHLIRLSQGKKYCLDCFKEYTRDY